MLHRTLIGALALLPMPAWAQNTSGVPGPAVVEGASAADYRVVASTGDSRGTRLAHRVQYEHAVTGSFRWRVVGQALTSDGDARLEYLQIDGLWQITPDDGRFQTGLRADARWGDGPAPERLGLVWTSQYAVTDRLALRGTAHGSVQIGDRARDGLSLETRASLTYDIGGDRTIGIETFHDHGRSPDPAPFAGRQQIGPFAVLPLADDWSLDASVLFGLSDQTQDLDFRLFVTRDF